MIDELLKNKIRESVKAIVEKDWIKYANKYLTVADISKYVQREDDRALSIGYIATQNWSNSTKNVLTPIIIEKATTEAIKLCEERIAQALFDICDDKQFLFKNEDPTPLIAELKTLIGDLQRKFTGLDNRMTEVQQTIGKSVTA